MNSLQGKNAILTGANGGLGGYLAEDLARAGVSLFHVGFVNPGLEALAARSVSLGVRSGFLSADLRSPDGRAEVVEAARRELGPVDILINNAGVEYSLPYDELTPAQLDEVLDVNLRAPMLLAHLVLPEMLRRRSGHILNISSLAGRSGPAFQEPYAASKAGLTGFTFSLRATCRGTGVSASVVTPGFVETGIYTRLKEKTGISAPPLLAPVHPKRVAAAALRALRTDAPEIVVSRYPVRPVLAILDLWPRLGLWMIGKLGAHEFFRRVVDAEHRVKEGSHH